MTKGTALEETSNLKSNLESGEVSNCSVSQLNMSGKMSKVLPVFKEFHSDLATEIISTKDDESDSEFDK